MKVRVEECCNGPGKYYFRCTLPGGERVNVGHNTDGAPWCREYASELRDYLQREHGVNRNSVKVI